MKRYYRKRFYGKPLPAKRQVKAHLDLLALIANEKKETTMNNATLKAADERLSENRDETRKILILENADHIVYETLDYQDGGNNSDHVWLYCNRLAIACVDMRSVTGVIVYPWPYSSEDDGSIVGRFGEH